MLITCPDQLALDSPQENVNVTSSTLGKINLQYKDPKETSTTYQKFAIPNQLISLNSSDSTLRFSTAFTMCGALIKQSNEAKNFNFTETYKRA